MKFVMMYSGRATGIGWLKMQDQKMEGQKDEKENAGPNVAEEKAGSENAEPEIREPASGRFKFN